MCFFSKRLLYGTLIFKLLRLQVKACPNQKIKEKEKIEYVAKCQWVKPKVELGGGTQDPNLLFFLSILFGWQFSY